MTFTLEDVAAHNTKEDCWQVIDGVVYNFTEYIASGDHPGGGAMIKDCGTDATEGYKTDHHTQNMLLRFFLSTG